MLVFLIFVALITIHQDVQAQKSLMVRDNNIIEDSKISTKITPEVLDNLDKSKNENEKISVVIKLKDDRLLAKASGKISLSSKDDRYKNYIQKDVSIDELQELEKSSDVVKISASHKIQAFLQQSNSIVNSSVAGLLQVSSVNLTGKDITVCVIDTGVDFTHPDLIGKNKSCVVDCYNKVCVEDCSLGDANGHGTHCAGIIGASGGIFGVASNVSLIGVRILNAAGGGSGNDLDLSRAVDWCVNENVSVISMSLGTVSLYKTGCEDSMSPWTESINAAYAANVSVIVASGNDANYSAIASPACITNATPVGDSYDANIGGIGWSACTDVTTALDKLVCHANRNSLVQLFAPGALINSTKTGGGYEERGGTSMACPMVAGAFAIINQVLNLTNQKKTPEQIESLFNSTGKRIIDTETGLTFSRIKIYPAVLELDNIAPSVSLIFPADNHINLTANHSFYCNTSDWQLSNITFKLWNSTTLFYNQTISVSETFSENVFNITNLAEENYKWTCISVDEKSNSGSSNNFSLIIGGLSSSLVSPLDFIYSNSNPVNFSCTSFSENLYSLSDVTFKLWNSTILVYNKTEDIIGFENTTNFNYNFSLQDSYYWTCTTINNNTNSSTADNYTLTYDSISPNISLISPTTGSSYSSNSQTISFTYNVSDTNNISNCSLIINNVVSLTNSSPISTGSNTFSKTFTPATYVWNINCSDVAGNRGNSSLRSFTVSAVSSSDDGDGGGGGGGSTTTAMTYSPTTAQTSGGYTQKLSTSDKIKFIFFDKVTAEHTLSVSSLSSDSVTLIIQSNPITLKLGIGQSAKINLTSTSYYDLYVKLNSIENNKADLTIQTINEKIIDSVAGTGKTIEAKDKEIEKGDINNEKIEKIGDGIKELKIIIYCLVLVIIVVIILMVIRGERVQKKIQKTKKEYKEKFNRELKPKKSKYLL